MRISFSFNGIMVLSVDHVALSKVIAEKDIFTAGLGLTRQFIESLKWQKTVSFDWAFWPVYFKISNC
jgi:hypothetical protein